MPSTSSKSACRENCTVTSLASVNRIDWRSVSIGGPYDASGPGDSLTRRRVFLCRPAASADEKPCAKQILSTLARRAYRRPVTDKDVETLLKFYDDGRSVGGFDQGIQRALERLLTDPDFLFRIERDPADLPPATP